MTEHRKGWEHESYPPAVANNSSPNSSSPPIFEQRAKQKARWQHKVVTIQQTIGGWISHGVFKVIVDGVENTDIVSGKSPGPANQEASIDQVLNYFARDGWRVETALMSQKGDTSFQYVMTRRVD
ncbi:hypothetical protein [Synechococcus sp. KORDI-52]|uniref:hypothetical protein n=1 Tax=Synechococcus sp. KORDI-52 TaxID=585425 RepID=UPI0012EC10F2|nr:hypothetical protein [Synechococcus sp. KORDI-52]